MYFYFENFEWHGDNGRSSESHQSTQDEMSANTLFINRNHHHVEMSVNECEQRCYNVTMMVFEGNFVTHLTL